MNASASPTPIRARVSWSIPLPTSLLPPKLGHRRRNASCCVSSTVTSCPSWSSMDASLAPTRPHPIITTFIVSSLPAGRTADYDLAGGIFEHILHIRILYERLVAVIAYTQHNRADPALHRLINHGVRGIPRP